MVLLRVRTPQGILRFEADDANVVAALEAQVAERLGVQAAPLSFQGTPLNSHVTISRLGFKRGDMLLFIGDNDAAQPQDAPSALPGTAAFQPKAVAPKETKAQGLAIAATPKVTVSVTLDKVDTELFKKDGKVPQNRTKLCRHAEGGRCLNCLPLEPYDTKVLASIEPPIKFISFHSHLRKLFSGADRGKLSTLHKYSNVVKPCTRHPPWPASICSHCTPSPLTLTRQEYRHVDYVEFECGSIVNEFIGAWRKDGAQRFGFLIGRYEEYDRAPLGIKAVVTAIYEPTQLSSASRIDFRAECHMAEVQEMVQHMGMTVVGCIFTHLEPTAHDMTKLKHIRYIDHEDDTSYIITGSEIMNIAKLQLEHPNPVPTDYSPDGHFGSKFVTVIATGDEGNNIELLGFQATQLAMDLVQGDIVRPDPKPGYLRLTPKNKSHFIPDVYYSRKDKYGNAIQSRVESFDVDYLHVQMPVAGQWDASDSTFSIKFPIENRPQTHVSVENAPQYFQTQDLQEFSDFHLLAYLYTNDNVSSIIKSAMPGLLKAVQAKDAGALHAWLQCEQWKTLALLFQLQTQPTLGQSAVVDSVPPSPKRTAHKSRSKTSSRGSSTGTSAVSSSSASHRHLPSTDAAPARATSGRSERSRRDVSGVSSSVKPLKTSRRQHSTSASSSSSTARSTSGQRASRTTTTRRTTGTSSSSTSSTSSAAASRLEDALSAHPKRRTPRPPRDTGPATSATSEWSCSACTFLNPNSRTSCELCTTPRP
eukprot:m.11082 g.11082  ORF g.11082 m.11082 type:complete len:759 (+) comp5666_c0_seq1:243-2519(+)